MEIVSLDLVTWAMLGGVLVPILVGIVSKCAAPASLKSVLNLVLSGIAGLVATAQATDGVLSKEAIVAWLLALTASIATYYGVYKPTGVSGSVQEATAGFGLGSASHSDDTPF